MKPSLYTIGKQPELIERAKNGDWNNFTESNNIEILIRHYVNEIYVHHPSSVILNGMEEYLKEPYKE